MKTKQVNSFLGVDGHGNCLPGPYRPLGMVRLGPDIAYPQPTHGYRTGSPVVRFSHTHVAGTGGCSRYGNIGVTPFCGEPRINQMTPFISMPLRKLVDALPQNEHGEVGYYSVRMMPWEVDVELTCTRHVGFHRYRYPDVEAAWILLDAASVIHNGLAPPGQLRDVEEWDAEGASIGGFIEQVGDREIVGRADLRGGWGHDRPYSVFFSLQADQPIQRSLVATAGGLAPGGEATCAVGPGCRTAISFGNIDELNLCVGISFVSIANARCYLKTEGARTFDEARQESIDEWEALMKPFTIEGSSDDQRALFYSCFYRIMAMPTDLGIDEGPFWNSGRRQFTDYYCLWDSIRNANSFFHMFMPQHSADMMNCLIDIADHSGWLPDAHITGHHAYMQSACAADILFAEAFAKKVPGVDYARALEHTRKNNQLPSPDLRSMGRYIDDYNSLGYLSTDTPKCSVSRHIEYTYHDWCIANLAKGLGQVDIADEFFGNSERIWNLWRQDLLSFAPRNPDGSWYEPFDPWTHAKESWNDMFCYEAAPIIWSLNPLHAIPELISRVGGDEAFVQHLDRIFDHGLYSVKETKMHVSHLYTYAGRPDRAAERVHQSLDCFANARDGIPGNEDMGCQSGFYLWNSVGLYPIIGQTHYMLSPPIFDHATLPAGPEKKELTINCERNGEGRYIKSVSLNGKSLDRAYIEHNEIADGGNLLFELSDEPVVFGRGPA